MANDPTSAGKMPDRIWARPHSGYGEPDRGSWDINQDGWMHQTVYVRDDLASPLPPPGSEGEAGHPRCATCAYFTPPGPDEHEITAHKGRGSCGRTPHSSNVSEWVEVDGDYLDQMRPEFEGRTAVVADGSGYYAKLLPSPEHYCAMHSALAPAPGEARPHKESGDV